jgi:hypothetical protein
MSQLSGVGTGSGPAGSGQHLRLLAGLLDDREQVTAQPTLVGQGHPEHGVRRDRGVHRTAPELQRTHAGLRGEHVHRAHHRVGQADGVDRGGGHARVSSVKDAR